MMAEKKPLLKRVAIGCAGALAVLAVFVAIVFLVVGKMTAEPERVVREFLAAAAAANYEVAHDYFSVPLKEEQPLSVFIDRAERTPSRFAVGELSINSRSIDSSGCELEGTATLEAGTRVPASFRLVRENDVWKLLSYSIGSSD
ncbi:MAG: hypothetical protein JSU87_03145 [Gemmatimonadota bacterium]|nr:MAG: hypothetical protein JSU87_03145 [Gemmatimonadota bacterium]